MPRDNQSPRRQKLTDPNCKPPKLAVEIHGLTKIYASSKKRPAVTALAGINLCVPRGSLFALLGPNGAGKSTLINTLGGLISKSDGSVKIWGIDIDQYPRNARAAIGIVPQELNMDAFFTPREYLNMQAGLYGVPPADTKTDEILARVGLSSVADSYARTLSGGMRRRLLIAKAMVHDPPVLVLDEPTAGVDIELREQLWENIRILNRGGVTVLITTHYLEEAEKLCDRIAIIHKGELIASERKETLLSRIDEKTLIITTDHPLVEMPPNLLQFSPLLTQKGAIMINYRKSVIQVNHILEEFRKAQLTIVDIQSEETNLGDVFLQLTQTSPHREKDPA